MFYTPMNYNSNDTYFSHNIYISRNNGIKGKVLCYVNKKNKKKKQCFIHNDAILYHLI